MAGSSPVTPPPPLPLHDMGDSPSTAPEKGGGFVLELERRNILLSRGIHKQAQLLKELDAEMAAVEVRCVPACPQCHSLRYQYTRSPFPPTHTRPHPTPVPYNRPSW